MTVHDTVHGFIVEREVPLPELDAVMYQMKHEKTGIELVWISREEENKVFCIGFMWFKKLSSQGAVCGAFKKFHEHIFECNDIPG